MPLYQDIEAQLKDPMRAQDKDRLMALRNIKSVLNNKAIDARRSSGTRPTRCSTTGTSRFRRQIEIIAKGGQKVVIDTSGDQIQITCTTGLVMVEAMNVEVKATGTMALEASGSMSLKAASMNVEATGHLTLKGGVVMIN